MAIASTMLELGTQAPEFALPDAVHGGVISSNDLIGRPMLVMFLCNHCPYVKHVEQQLGQLARDYSGSPLAVVAICSNDVEVQPADGPDGLRDQAQRAGFIFPYLVDEAQDIAHAFTAACTPDLFLYDPAHALAYRGQLDDSRPGSATPVTGADIRAAIDAVLAGEPAPGEQRPSLGCGIKWK